MHGRLSQYSHSGSGLHYVGLSICCIYLNRCCTLFSSRPQINAAFNDIHNNRQGCSDDGCKCEDTV